MWFPVRHQFENLALSVRKFNFSCEINVPKEAMLEVFYNDGEGWHSSKKVEIETKSVDVDHLVEFPTVLVSSLTALRLDISTLDTLESFDAAVSVLAVDAFKSEYRIDLLSDAELTSKCVEINKLAGSKGFETTQTCEDAQLSFKTDFSGFDLNVYSKFDHILLILLGLSYAGLLTFLWIRVPNLSIAKPASLPHAIGSFLFLVFVGSHWYLVASGHSGVDPTFEKRQLEDFPSDSTEHFSKDFDTWFEDHYAIRQHLTRFKSLVSYHGLKKSALPDKLIMGANDQLYPSSEFILDDFMGRMKLTPLQMISIHKIISERINYMQSLGKDFYLLIPPSKQTIYPREVPERYRKTWNPDSTMLSQLVRFLMNDSLMAKHICDPRSDLLSATESNKERLYFDADIHWNGHGAFIGYQRLFKQISAKHNGFTPYQLDDFNIESRFDDEGDLARLLMMHQDLPRLNHYYSLKNGPGYFLEEIEGDYAFPLFRSTIADSTLPRALIFRDSYCQDLMQFFGLHFSDALFIWDQEFDVDQIEKQEPDIVIQEVTEMMIYDLLRINPKTVQVNG